MADSIQIELEKLSAAATGLEAQRTILGDSIVGPALDSLYEKIKALKSQVEAKNGLSADSRPADSRPAELRSERRIVTVLFSDIVGSTALASHFDPEEWREIITAVHSLAGAQIHKFNGNVLQYLGDGLLALFGSKNASENDPDHALRAALGIQAEVPKLAEGGLLPAEYDLKLRIGIHTGLVVIGELGSETKMELTATGDAMNLAARLQSAAPPGGILISHGTYRYVRESFEALPQAPLSVKGKNEPLRTYLVQRANPARFRTVTRGITGVDTPTVGREAELSQLRLAYDEVMEGQTTRWVQITGEAGVGKSRLVEEMRKYFPGRTTQYHLFKCRAYSGDERQAYAMIRRMWMDFFHIPEELTAEEIEVRWLDAIRTAGHPTTQPVNPDRANSSTGAHSPVILEGALLDEAARALGYLIGIPFSSTNFPPSHIQPAQLKNHALMVSRQLFTSLDQSAPVVVLLEDVHWLDRASWDHFIDLFMETPRVSKTLRILILATSRLEWSPPPALYGHPAYRELKISPLTLDASSRLTEAILKDTTGVPAHVIRRIIERSEGIPYFIEEMVNLLLDLGVIDQSAPPWRYVAEKYKPELLPDTLQHLLQTRLDHLNAHEKTALQYAAVLGRRFWEGWLDSQLVTGSHPVLMALQTRGFINQQSEAAFEGEIEWRFYHQLQQEAAYASLLKRQRKLLHQAAAGWLEQMAARGNRLDEYAGSIGEHTQEAGDSRNASSWYFRAGNHAKRRAALTEARAYYERALSLVPEADLDRRWEILLEHDEVLGLLAETQARMAEDALLVSLAQQMGRQDHLAEAYDRQGNYLNYCGDNTQAVPLLKMAYRIASDNHQLKIACQALGMLVISLAQSGEVEEAGRYVGRVLELAEQCGDELSLAMGLNNLSTYYSLLGDHYQAIQLINRQVVLTRKMKHRMGEAIGLGNLGYGYILIGLFSLGIVTLEKAFELSQAFGMQRDAAYAQLNLGLAYMRVDDFASARQVLESAMERLTGTQDNFGLAAGRLYLGLAYEKQGDCAQADEWFRQAAETYTRISIPGSAMDCRAGQGRCALAEGDLLKAQSLIQEVWEYLRLNRGAGMEFPILAYQTCFIFFERTAQSPRMAEALEAGYELLVEKANRISDLQWRKIFLHDIPENDWMYNQVNLLTEREI